MPLCNVMVLAPIFPMICATPRLSHCWAKRFSAALRWTQQQAQSNALSVWRAHCCIVAHHWARLILLCGKIMGWKSECNTGVWLTLKGISSQLQTFVIVKDKSLQSFKNIFIGLTWNCALNCECLWYDKYGTPPCSLQLDAYLLADHLDLESKIQSVPLWFN